MGPLLLIMNSVLNTTWDRDSLRKGIKRPLNIKDQPTLKPTSSIILSTHILSEENYVFQGLLVIRGFSAKLVPKNVPKESFISKDFGQVQKCWGVAKIFLTQFDGSCLLITK